MIFNVFKLDNCTKDHPTWPTENRLGCGDRVMLLATRHSEILGSG